MTTPAISSQDEFIKLMKKRVFKNSLYDGPFKIWFSSEVTGLSKDGFITIENSEDFYALHPTTDLCCHPPVDGILLPKKFQSVDSSCAAKNLVGNGRKLKKKKKKNCVGISNAKKKKKVARSTKCKKQRAIKV